MPALFFAFAVASALLYFRARHRGERRPIYLFKPLTTLLLLGAALSMPAPVSPFYRAAIGVGLACSLAGDIFLMLPSDRFVAGLVSFLVAHAWYIAAFASDGGFRLDPWPLVPFLLAGLALLRYLWPHTGRLRPAVTVYGLVLVVMTWQAVARWLSMGNAGAAWAAAGAVLFFASDALLAANRFARPLPHAPTLVMGTYYAAQALLALSV
jgi:uncharacterized membrane protein YhhN